MADSAHPRAVRKATAAGQIRSLAGEQPCLPASFIQPNQAQTISLPNSFQLPHHLGSSCPAPTRLDPSTFPKPHRNSCSSYGAKVTPCQRAMCFVCFFGVHPLQLPQTSETLMFTETSSKRKGVYRPCSGLPSAAGPTVTLRFYCPEGPSMRPGAPLGTALGQRQKRTEFFCC